MAREPSVGGDFLSILQESARKGTLLSSCEEEVRELMHQLDVHISARCKGWQEQVTLLAGQLDSTQQEVAHLQQELHKKTTQLEEVERKASQTELDYQTKMANLEAQLQQVRSSLTLLNTRYTELRQKRYSRAKSKHSETKVNISLKSKDPLNASPSHSGGSVSTTTRRWERRSETSPSTKIPNRTSTEGEQVSGDREGEEPVGVALPSSELVDRLVEEQLQLLNHDLLQVLKNS